VIALAGIAAASLALSVVRLVIEPGEAVRSSGANAFSRSALGHLALVELLRATGTPVLVSRFASAERASTSSLLLIAEPSLESDEELRAGRLREMTKRAATTLLVLPKWEGSKVPERPSWIQTVKLVGEERLRFTLQAANVPAAVARPDSSGDCDDRPRVDGWAHPQLLAATSAAFHPLIRCAGGVLLGEVAGATGSRLLVLSDPDFISNHGLAKADGASRALDIIDRARRHGQPVVLDETLHGFERVPSPWSELFEFPLLPAVLQALLALSALAWSGLARFGPPLPDPTPAATGRALLIANTADLLGSAGHSVHSLGRYLDATIADLAQILHAPALSGPEARRTWLAASARTRRGGTGLPTIEARIAELGQAPRPSPAAIVAAARSIFRWKKEMLRESKDDPRDQGTAAR
jgi:hypothetical protein